MTRPPRFKLASQIFSARFAQFSDYFRVVRREPVVKLVKRLHAVENGFWYDDVLLCHARTITGSQGKIQLICATKTNLKLRRRKSHLISGSLTSGSIFPRPIVPATQCPA